LAAIQIELSMQKFVTTFLLCFFLTPSFCQTQRKVSTYLLTQYNKTLHDYTIGNNPWGIGVGLQTFFNYKTKFKPTIELTADVYLEDDKVFRSNPDGTFPESGNDVRGMVNLFAGSSFHPNESIYLSLLAGLSFISGQTLVGIKPSFGFYFSKTQKWTGKVSYINVFNRTKIINEDFGSLSLAIGVKLL
jgi:hypothetical protein